MESKRVTSGSFTWSPPFSLGKVRRQAAVLLPMFQAFLYARSHTAVRILKSDSGHLIRGAEKENSGGRQRERLFLLHNHTDL